ncbi:LysR substrate-binding domain-containing protein [Pectobacterium versatile]|uniref:LysR substrate-binding domain-containing protein n=1 Tax=Pectobacterium versatile TaxID=2488639 RepID=UPI001F318077|nr:LysR substrate-binding domain-containing protein [Pectobacterium versatile]
MDGNHSAYHSARVISLRPPNGETPHYVRCAVLAPAGCSRSTQTLALTAEGERCRSILSEVEAAELEMTQASETPHGKLRVSLPRHSSLFEPVIADFMRRYPVVELDLDFSDRLVDVIGDGFDAAIRTGTLADSGLKRRQLGTFRRVLVGAPEYFKEHGQPQHPMDLQAHICLHYRFPSSGRLEPWPLPPTAGETPNDIPLSLVCNSIEMRIHLARQAQGIACLPDFSVAKYLRDGRLQTILNDFTHNSSPMWILWPASRDLSPKLRAFIDCLNEKTFG